MIVSKDDATPGEDSSGDPLGSIVDEYLELERRGSQRELEAFLAKHRDHADKLRELLPVAELLDNARPTPNEFDSDYESIGAGSQLGDYCLMQVIGRGGMGVVYQAEHVLLGSIVAIKVLPRTLNNAKHRERFLREASAAAQMNHPNIVRVFDFGSQGDTLFYVMSLIQGCGLNQWIHDRGIQKDALPGFDSSSSGSSRRQATKWHSVAHVGLQAADALSYAHDMGVVHRDIKPGNLMLERDGTIYVTDFGLAKVTSDLGLTGTGDLLGTLRYLPPESFRGEVDHRSDIYSLGLTLYELACGQPVFKGEDRAKLLHDISEGQVRPLRKVEPRIPQDLDKIITKAIDPDPRSRFADAAAMRDDLRRFLAGKPVSARPASIPYRTTRWLSRNKVIASLAGGLILILAVVSVVAAMAASQFESLASAESQQRIAAESALKKADRASEARTQVTVRSLVDDAESKTTTGRPRQRLGALDSLANAIRLTEGNPRLRDQIAREHGMSWDLMVQDLATRALVLPDLELVDRWSHPHANGQPFAFRSDLKRYVMVDYDNYPARVSIYDRRGEIVQSTALPNNGWVTWLGWWQQQNQVAMTLTDGTTAELYAWDISSNRLRNMNRPAEAVSMHHAMIGQSGDVLLLRPGNVFERIDLESGTTRWSQKFEIAIDRVLLSSDERWAALVPSESPVVLLVDLEASMVRELTVDANVTTVAWHPDGNRIAIACTDGLSVFDLRNNDVVARAKGESGSLYHLAYSQDGSLLLGAGERRVTKVWQSMLDQEVLRVESDVTQTRGSEGSMLFETSDGFEIRRVVSPSIQQVIGMDVHRVTDAVVRQDTADVVLACSSGLFVYDRDTTHLKATHRFAQHAPQLAMDEEETVYYHDFSNVYRTKSGELPDQNDEPIIKFGEAMLIDLDVSFDGDQLAVLNLSPPSLTVYSTNDFELLATIETDFNTSSVRFTEDGRQLLLGLSRPGLARVIDAETFEQIDAFDSMPIDFIGFDRDRWLVNRGGGLRILDKTDTVRPLIETTVGELSDWKLPSLSKIVLSADGGNIATETLSPRAALVLRRSDQRPVRILPGLNRQPESQPLAFSRDGRYFVTERGRSNVAIWDLKALDEQLDAFVKSAETAVD